MITTWYLQSQRTWDKLCHSCIGSSFLPRGAFPEGGAYAVSQRLHAGSLEALRVSRPEAVVLAVNNWKLSICYGKAGLTDAEFVGDLVLRSPAAHGGDNGTTSGGLPIHFLMATSS